MSKVDAVEVVKEAPMLMRVKITRAQFKALQKLALDENTTPSDLAGRAIVDRYGLEATA